MDEQFDYRASIPPDRDLEELGYHVGEIPPLLHSCCARQSQRDSLCTSRYRAGWKWLFLCPPSTERGGPLYVAIDATDRILVICDICHMYWPALFSSAHFEQLSDEDVIHDINRQYLLLTHPRKLGQMLYRARLKRGLTRAELASKLMLTSRAIRSWEMGERLPDRDYIGPVMAFVQRGRIEYALSRDEA